jgi:hypothetical protein
MRMLLHCLMLIFISRTLHAQVKRELLSGELVKEKKSEPLNNQVWKNKIFFGGNAGLQFGSLTFIDISPFVGYRINDKIHVGIGGSYIYTSNRFIRRSATILGARVFARYFFKPYFFAHAENEWLRSSALFSQTGSLNTPLVGIGYRQMIGTRGFMDLTGLWNFSIHSATYYSNPVIRIGFCFQ